MNTRAIIFAAILVLSSGCSSAAIQETPRIRRDRWLSSLPVSLKETAEAKTLTISFCPDNTCEAFVGPISTREEIKDFVLLYLSRVSQYTILKQSQESMPERDLQPFLKKYGGPCKESSTVLCAVDKMKADYRIQVFFSRWDEANEHREEIR